MVLSDISDDGPLGPSSDNRHQIRVFSFGGGVQSTAALVLAAQGRIDYQTFLFADTGDEHPDTYDYLTSVHLPFAEKHGIEIRVLKKTWRDGSQYSILEQIDRLKSALPIPAYLDSGKPLRRHCTSDWKVLVLDKYMKEQGATPTAPMACGMGISLDEVHRARDSRVPFKVLEYPLLDLRLRRSDCVKITSDAGLPPAPRSACYYCPFHSTEHWRDLREDHPVLFARAVELETELSTRAERYFGSGVRLWRRDKLANLDDQQRLVFDDGPEDCDSGHCFT